MFLLPLVSCPEFGYLGINVELDRILVRGLQLGNFCAVSPKTSQILSRTAFAYEENYGLQLCHYSPN
jgi:hypothetical protein